MEETTTSEAAETNEEEVVYTEMPEPVADETQAGTPVEAAGPRFITEHHNNGGMNTEISVIAGPPGPGGASNQYRLLLGKAPVDGSPDRVSEEHILFQNGSPAEVGVNGITMEVLLSIVADRLRGFQSGPYPHPMNAAALRSVEDALRYLSKRTVAGEPA